MGQALALTQAALAAPSDLKGVFEIEAFKNNCIANYEKTTGKSDGALRFEREKILFMKLMSDPKIGKKLAACSRFSVYSSMVELFVSGLTLNEGQTYIIPYGDQAQFQIGWKGRLEQMAAMPQIREVYQPEVVMTNELDEFVYTLGEEPRIIQHKPARNRDVTPENRIEWVYVILDKGHRKKCVLMSRQQVLSIRDRFSQPYKNYIKNGGKWPDGNPMDPPFWITDEIAAFKKTVVKRAYDSEPKTARQKALDEKIKNNVDLEDQLQETENIDYGIVDDKPRTNTGTPEPRAITQGDTSNGPSDNKVGDPAATSEPSAKDKPARTRRTKEQIAKDEADKKAAESKAEPEKKTAVTENGTKFDPTTAEVMPDGPGDDNPVFDLPDLGNIKNF